MITLPTEILKALEKVLKIEQDRRLSLCLNECKRTGYCSRATVARALEALNEIYWERVDLSHRTKESLRALYNKLDEASKKPVRNPRPPSKPNRYRGVGNKLDEIKRRQELRRNSHMETDMDLKSELIKLGNSEPELRPHLAEVLNVLEQETPRGKQAASKDSLNGMQRAYFERVIEHLRKEYRGSNLVVGDLTKYNTFDVINKDRRSVVAEIELRYDGSVIHVVGTGRLGSLNVSQRGDYSPKKLAGVIAREIYDKIL